MPLLGEKPSAFTSFLTAVAKELDDGQFRKGRAYLSSQFKATDTHDNRSLRPLVTFHP